MFKKVVLRNRNPIKQILLQSRKHFPLKRKLTLVDRKQKQKQKQKQPTKTRKYYVTNFLFK